MWFRICLEGTLLEPRRILPDAQKLRDSSSGTGTCQHTQAWLYRFVNHTCFGMTSHPTPVLDNLTSGVSTFPFNASQCREFLEQLRDCIPSSAADDDIIRDGYMTCFIGS